MASSRPVAYLRVWFSPLQPAMPDRRKHIPDFPAVAGLNPISKVGHFASGLSIPDFPAPFDFHNKSNLGASGGERLAADDSKVRQAVITL